MIDEKNTQFSEFDKIQSQAAYDRINSLGENTNASSILDLRNHLFRIYFQDGLSHKGKEVLRGMIGLIVLQGHKQIPGLLDIDKKIWIV